MNILYLHGMGGGADSRIPRILREHFAQNPPETGPVDVICRTYDFNPEIASRQIREWVEETDPVLVIGESLGSNHAIRIMRTHSLDKVPHILVSPALNVTWYMKVFAWTTGLPGVTKFLNWFYAPTRPDRQEMCFTPAVMKAYGRLRSEIFSTDYSDGIYYAFFGSRDHYRRTGVVSIRQWVRLFGKESYSIYDGSHFMEEEFVYSLLIPKILLYLRTYLN